MSERPPLPSDRVTSILALGGDREQAIVALIEPVEGVYRLAGWDRLPLAIDEETRYTLPERLSQACQQLERQLGHTLWDSAAGTPALVDPEPALGLALGHVVAVADPLPPLRVWIAGLSAGESLAAAQEAITAAPCEPIALYRMGPEEDPLALAAELTNANPDVLIVAGGYDQADEAARLPVLALCDLVAMAVRRLPVDRRPRLCFAGNRWAAAAALESWRQIPNIEVAAVLNVLPDLGKVQTSSLAAMLSQWYWSRSKADVALQQIAAWITPPAVLRSQQWSFAQAVRLWREIHNLPYLHALYCGHPHWMHVWATADEVGVRVRFVAPQTRPASLDLWPPLRLVSGSWPDLWPRPELSWQEPQRILPVVAAIGQINAEAALHVLMYDLLEREQAE
jgi:hypothetical protein